MNHQPIAPRLMSLVLAVLVTASMLGTIDALAHARYTADSLLAQSTSLAAGRS